MELQTAADIPMHVKSVNSSSERRISPAWTIKQFKARLEPITGIPAASQKLSLRLGGSQRQPLPIEASDENSTTLAAWPLQPYAEIYVESTSPTSTTEPTFSTSALASVDKYTMPASEYDARPDTVQAYKRTHQIGRFDPTAPAQLAAKASEFNAQIAERGIAVGQRCRLLPAESDGRRGTIAFIGAVEELPGVEGAMWVGVRLDEPVGKNDGSVKGRRYFEAGRNCGAFVRGERVEVGEFEEEGLEGLDSDMEEI